MSDQREIAPKRTQVQWFLQGARNLASIPAMILMLAFVGFGGLTREAGLSTVEAVMLAVTVWALPSSVLVVGAILDGVPFYATVFAVMLSSVRLMPMTMSLIPLMKSEKTTTFHLVLASNFVAVTAWVYSMKKLPELPREARLTFFLGFGATLAAVNALITAISHTLATSFPPVMGVALVFLTPIYFLISMSEAASKNEEYLAIGLGFALGPVFHQIAPDTDLLWCGLVGGSLAYALSRFSNRGKV